MKPKLLVAIWIVFLVVLMETASFAALSILEHKKGIQYRPKSEIFLKDYQVGIIEHMLTETRRYIRLDPDLGWSISPDAQYSMYRSNAQGLRAERNYRAAPPDDMYRVLTFGDSFTHGSEVELDGTWQLLMERLDSGLEVLNFGVSTYGTGQAYLRFEKERSNFAADAVFIGIMPENIFRVVNTFRPFYQPQSRFPLSKPSFKLSHAGELERVPNLLRTEDDYRYFLRNQQHVISMLGQEDYFYKNAYRESAFDALASVRLFKVVTQLWNDESVLDAEGTYSATATSFKVFTKLVERFYREGESASGLSVVVMLPDRTDILRRINGQTVSYQPLLDFLEQSGMEYIDLGEAFHDALSTGEQVEQIFLKLHYSPKGNAIVANALVRKLNELRK